LRSESLIVVINDGAGTTVGTADDVDDEDDDDLPAGTSAGRRATYTEPSAP
jgi:hypothetical protein